MVRVRAEEELQKTKQVRDETKLFSIVELSLIFGAQDLVVSTTSVSELKQQLVDEKAAHELTKRTAETETRDNSQWK